VLFTHARSSTHVKNDLVCRQLLCCTTVDVENIFSVLLRDHIHWAQVFVVDRESHHVWGVLLPELLVGKGRGSLQSG